MKNLFNKVKAFAQANPLASAAIGIVVLGLCIAMC